VPTRASKALDNMTIDDLMKFTKAGPLWAVSTIVKHGWVLHLYRPMCEKLGIEAFPLTELNAPTFIRFLGLGAGYKVTSIEVHLSFFCSFGYLFFYFHSCNYKLQIFTLMIFRAQSLAL
jgi:hypothetical protein